MRVFNYRGLPGTSVNESLRVRRAGSAGCFSKLCPPADKNNAQARRDVEIAPRTPPGADTALFSAPLRPLCVLLVPQEPSAPTMDKGMSTVGEILSVFRKQRSSHSSCERGGLSPGPLSRTTVRQAHAARFHVLSALQHADYDDFLVLHRLYIM